MNKNYKKQNQKDKMIKKIQPQGIRKIYCPNPKCKELMVKVYPWANFIVNGAIQPCNKCRNNSNKVL